MTDTANPIPEELALNRVSEDGSSSQSVLLATVTPALYLENPFRRLGLSVLAGPREINRRLDELKLSAELGTAVMEWAFAPEAGLTVNEIRETAQKLKSPRDRLIHEFFWFWPESYPENTADEALACLARGETAPALEHWLRAATAGSRAARHNLAIYHHLLVLDWEWLPEDEASRLEEVWPQTMQYWQDLADDEPLWTLVQNRVLALGDAQVPENFADEMRATLPGALSRINAGLLRTHVERGHADRAALHASLIALIHRDAAGVRRTLDECAAPIASRIDTFVASARRAVARETSNALLVAGTLVRNCDDDLRLVDTLCGGDEAYAELSNSVADAALACLVAHQRRTQEDRNCLPLLVYLLNMAVTPEQRRRLEETYRVICTNIFPSDDSISGDGLAMECRLIVEVILPRIDSLQLSPRGQLQFSSRVVEWLAQLGITAWRDLNRADLAAAAFANALAAHCEPSSRAQLEQEWEHLQYEIDRQAKVVNLERNGYVVIINADEICFGDLRLPLRDVTGFRHSAACPDHELTVAWCSAETVIVLDRRNFFSGDAAEADYTAITAAIDCFLAPELTGRLIDALHKEAIIFLDETPMTRGGMALTVGPLFLPENLVPYPRLQHEFRDGFLIVTDGENPALTQSFSLSQVWNTTIMGHVITALAGDNNFST